MSDTPNPPTDVDSDGPEGEVNYYLSASGGSASMAIGDLEGPDVTVKQSYDTASAISGSMKSV